MHALPKTFDAANAAMRWTIRWREGRYFESTPDDRPPYTIVMPPPNVTGVLHMGHTLNCTVQDVLIRRARQTGYNACWVPGSDHASIATESKVVALLAEQGIDKASLTREEFLKHAFAWKEKYGGIIYQQVEALGFSVDWSRATFTMDDHYYRAVISTFVDLYGKGLIYRGARMINWDPVAKTALSDEEVEYRDEAGRMYYVKYKIINPPAGGPTHITIATQRPETIMGDTGVCVNPTDERYASLRGCRVMVPLVDREVPIIFDEYVDPAFGTGVLKVTPAHDINDYNLGLKHGLPIIDTLTEEGRMAEAAGVFVGMDRFEARAAVVQQLRDEGSLVDEKPNPTRLGYSQRSGAVVEPRISTQWFLKMESFAAKALEAVQSGDVALHPADRFDATYTHWLSNIKDWCISRQLWWGQRIPAWYDAQGEVYVGATREEAEDAWRAKNPGVSEVPSLSQDEDVLDTWFSSWLWPMEVFGGLTEPDNRDFNYYYPTNVLVTGQDIIFFWVARMIMAAKEYTGQKPFDRVYFTGMVRDKLGRKMSKSLGNSPDLLKLIDDYGADAVRFGILISSPAGNDLLFDESSLDQGRTFGNKIWNAAKLLRIWQEKGGSTEAASEAAIFAQEWFDARLSVATGELQKLYADLRLSEALKTVYSLIWDDFCSAYLEWIKPQAGNAMSQSVLDKAIAHFEALLTLLHPFMPFITEEISAAISFKPDPVCIRQAILPTNLISNEILEQAARLREAITAVREATLKAGIKTREGFDLRVETKNQSLYAAISPILCKLTGGTNLEIASEPPASAITVVLGKDKFYIVSETFTDVSSQRAEWEKDLAYQEGFLASVDKKLSNERFVQNAKPEVVELERRKRADAEEKIRLLQGSLAALSE